MDGQPQQVSITARFSPMPTPPSPQSIVERYLTSYNDRDLDEIREVIAPTIESEGATFDRDDLIDAIETYWAAFPDCAHHDISYVSADDLVTVRTRFAGTHEHEYHGLEPTGNAFEVTEFMLFRVTNGEIDAYWFAWDELGFFEQLGVLEHPLR